SFRAQKERDERKHKKDEEKRERSDINHAKLFDLSLQLVETLQNSDEILIDSCCEVFCFDIHDEIENEILMLHESD
ncbi:MAG: hypothetical protein Q9203_007787, partial [Teloschistes exilis]